jgi:hypothetical protein
MARGWGSKSVEGQIESAEAKTQAFHAVKLTPTERARREQRESLELSRKRVLDDLAVATHPNRRAMLEAALKHLEDQIAALG